MSQGMHNHVHKYIHVCITYIYICKYINIYMCTSIHGSVSDKGLTLQYPEAKYHVFNLSTSCAFVLVLSHVSICSMCYVYFCSLSYV